MGLSFFLKSWFDKIFMDFFPKQVEIVVFWFSKVGE